LEPTAITPAFSLVFLMGLFIFSIGILGTLFWIWMIIDCAQKESSEGNDKIVWILIIIFTHLLGALIYFFARKLPRQNSPG